MIERETHLEATKDQRLWAEALNLAINFSFEQVEELPIDRFEEIGLELGNCINFVEDLRALGRIAERARV